MSSRIALAFLVASMWAVPGPGWSSDESAPGEQQASDEAATYQLAAGDKVVITVFGHDLSRTSGGRGRRGGTKDHNDWNSAPC